MKPNTFIKATAAVLLFSATACYNVEDNEFSDLSPISFNEVPSVINIKLGSELVYNELVVKSDLPVTYEWAYGKKKTVGAAGEYDMLSIEKVSDKPDIRYTFPRIGSYILRLRVDNGEDIKYKYFTLNVNSGLDEGVLLLCNDDAGKGSLTFVKKRTDEEVAQNEQEVWPDIFSKINNGASISKGTDMYMSLHTSKEIQYTQLLVATDDAEGSIYKLEPKTFELLATNTMRPEFETSCAGFAGDAASGATYNYVFIRGADGRTFRYDLFADFIGERQDASEAGLVTGNKMLVYNKYRKPVLYNDSILFQPGNAKVTIRKEDGHSIVNFYSDRDNNKTYVIFRNKKKPDNYVIKYTNGSLAAFKNVTKFTASELNMDEKSIMASSINSNDVYYSFNNAIYRWSLVAKPYETPAIALPSGETICDMAVNYMGALGDDTQESLLLVATYNHSREGAKKGSLFIYNIKDNSLLKSYEGICDKPVKVMYKYRVS